MSARAYQEKGKTLIEKRDNTPYRVLVAEDKDIAQRMAQIVFEALQCSIEFASNGEEALQAACNNSYDIIFMDCRMPLMDGIEVTKALRMFETTHPNRRRIPVVALTSLAMKEDRDRCLASGMDDYLAKPLRPEKAIEVINKLCARTEEFQERW
jgi:CheY-like chemotaxis protein